MKKSAVLWVVPPGVASVSRPEVPPEGTVVERDVAVAELTVAWVMLKSSRLLAAIVSKFVPVTVTAVAGVATVGVKFEMVGAPLEVVTVNGLALVADPAGAVTAIGPVVAPTGTLVTIWVGVDDVTDAAVPLNVTVFWLGVGLKPVPKIVTVVPSGPLGGWNSMRDTSEEL
jgi:hypothetical protein